MWTYNYTCNYNYLELYHHGILGQRWGDQNGPPYPLKGSDHSSSEKKAGYQKSIDKDSSNNNGKSKKFQLTDKQKTALKVGAAVAATALVTYGAYKLTKSGTFDQAIAKGKQAADAILNKTDSLSGLKKLSSPESISDTIKKANPLANSPEGKNNCVNSALASFLRQQGYDVTALGNEGKTLDPVNVVEECFKGVNTNTNRMVTGTASKFGKSSKDAAEMLKDKFGNNASGICDVSIKGQQVRHCFNWDIKDAAVSFFDGQRGSDNATVSNKYFSRIDTNGSMTLARLDGAELNIDALKKYIK